MTSPNWQKLDDVRYNIDINPYHTAQIVLCTDDRWHIEEKLDGRTRMVRHIASPTPADAAQLFRLTHCAECPDAAIPGEKPTVSDEVKAAELEALRAAAKERNRIARRSRKARRERVAADPLAALFS